MTRRLVLCEGPDDVAALRELALYVFKAIAEKQSIAGTPGGEPRTQKLRAGQIAIEIKASRAGKSGLIKMIGESLAALGPQDGPPEEAKVRRIAAVFDPDEEPVTAFHKGVASSVAREAPDWRLVQVGSGTWLARRMPGERVQVRAIPWRAPGPVVDGLADHQNLERLLCAVAKAAYPAEAAIVERWLTEITTVSGKTPKWKAALHLWCALVDQSASELNAATRFLHQNGDCKPHVSPALEKVGLLRALRPLFAAP